MPNRREGAPGSFGAPLDQLLPRLGGHGGIQVEVDIHRKPSHERETPAEQCRIFMLNQGLYEAAKK